MTRMGERRGGGCLKERSQLENLGVDGRIVLK
jgi:hypothetical protein